MEKDKGFEFLTTYMDWLATLSVEDAVFRGHANAEWDIVPTGYRAQARGIVSELNLSLWKDMAIRFVSPRPTNKLEWLVLAQHHGIPTNLLDWTSNPLTALFFACTIAGDRPSDGRVISINIDEFEDDELKVVADPFLKDEINAVLINASTMNVRSMAQDSYMSVHPADCPEIMVGEYRIDNFVVPQKCKKDALSALSGLGVTEERLYTDIGAVVTVFKKKIETMGDIYSLLAERRA